ncbi:polyprenyl synthetase family protein [Kineosporia succinea]|uniref:Heptaprenyl diphosphate synthase n=1 Tax=Kineosporia succinea TaxID=84632 RepID=A0ABT9P360_9ACTN|nr:polyprenyl synthetase family protein [Kineosporia succinea]MDP9827122.1 heptaprenyl diphosphate synthase [Kineosporia succinea]
MTASLDLPVADAALAESVRAGLDTIEARLREAVKHADQLADTASRHLVEAGGKRVRPMLTLLAAHLGDGHRPEVVQAGVVVELTHLASLYHDDVMDSADQRRGAAAAHLVWGNQIAILVGDLLFARASRIVAELGPEAVDIQAATFERLCLGQMHETVGPSAQEDPVAHYLQVLGDKTGSLIATAGRFGAMFGGCDAETVDIMIRYGELVGVAFQLADDVIDLSSAGRVSGKVQGTDLREGVPTLPTLLARRAAAEGDAEAQRIVDMLDGDLSDDARLAETIEALNEHKVMSAARDESARWAHEAIGALEPLPESSAKLALRQFAEAVVDRTR